MVTYLGKKKIACSRHSDSGKRCEVKKHVKSRGGTGESGEGTSLTSPPSLVFIFSHFFLIRTAPHYLNAWNRQEKKTHKAGNIANYTWQKTARMSCHNFETNGAATINLPPLGLRGGKSPLT